MPGAPISSLSETSLNLENKGHTGPEGESVPLLVRQMLGRPPGWALRWGMVAAGVALALLIALAAVIRYPDVVEAEVLLWEGGLPIEVRAPFSGVVALWVEDGQQVAEGEWLFSKKGSMSRAAAEELEAWLAGGAAGPLPSLEGLGILEAPWAAYLQARLALEDEAHLSAISQQLASLAVQQRAQEQLDSVFTAQAFSLEREAALAEVDWERAKTLLAGGGISQLEVDQAEVAWLRAGEALRQVALAQQGNNRELQRLRREQIILREQGRQQLRERESQLSLSLAQLKSAYATWRSAAVGEAPASGRVQLRRQLQDGVYIPAGGAMLALVPDEPQQGCHAAGFLSAKGLGKVSPGQPARLSLPGYPEAEFGALQATVSSIGQVAEESQWPLSLIVECPWVTVYGDTLSIKPGTPALARIRTADRSLLQRLAGQLWILAGH